MWPKHRDLQPIPTDPQERKARLNWLRNHKIWCHPITPDPEFWTRQGLDIDTLHNDVGRFSSRWDEDALYTWFEHVDPATGDRNADDDTKNTEFQIWVEAGPCRSMKPRSECPDPDASIPEGGWTDHNQWHCRPDLRLDAYAPDYETMMLRLAMLVDLFYNEAGGDRLGPDGVPAIWCSWRDWYCDDATGEKFVKDAEKRECEREEDHPFCKHCGFRMAE